MDLSNCGSNALTLLRDINYVAHVSIIDQVINRDLSTLFTVAKEVLLNLISNRDGTFKVIVKRMDKKYPMTSIELAKKLGEYLAQFAKADLENPDYVIYIEVREDSFIVAHSTRDLFRKRREAIPMDWVDKVIGIVEGPKEVYETMDLIQLSHALGVEVRLITSQLLVDRALRALKLNSLPRVRVVNVEEALSGVDIPIVLSMHANYNERKLIEVSREAFSRGLRIGLILGNEYEDVSLALRSRAMYEVRLGPMTGHPMRTTIALAYAISVIYTTWLINQ
ncbi:THUMP domain-containing protein [Vulcanisaeta sp. JCM 16161]|uniref:THUMP domain-containing protein n=1 Tax=Vulcanisaeta sp. JCM 16161 TaxID=1295372 RepID=UPI001FB3997A|nr:THUMP domain-containing protein [Vulcanisaeta sp. JCM 16161]